MTNNTDISPERVKTLCKDLTEQAVINQACGDDEKAQELIDWRDALNALLARVEKYEWALRQIAHYRPRGAGVYVPVDDATAYHRMMKVARAALADAGDDSDG